MLCKCSFMIHLTSFSNQMANLKTQKYHVSENSGAALPGRLRGSEDSSCRIQCPMDAFFLMILFFLIEVQLIYNVVLVLGVHQSDTVIYMCVCIYIYIYILFQILFPYRLLQNIECSSLCCTVGASWLSILYIVVCTC